ncbi:TOPRIM nucleotidyl transferase/hydrolase domain-containing protein [Clostridium beijerinckii]|uniref:ABC-type lipoprotein export system ATPase subunit n=1 Tax=Clostridium beijerinckii TaxID=1520 RepID=A0AAE5EY14_CLOBE|nr:TOPRIM nucleotidyl transferase/hydrolase domain-containing protein [Clostridium beijerinckii]NSB16794.1 ABC-type lipoprotein export system ATPase subunit [Clostridium beijerinckii]OOM31401.1 hypothetical protein CLOBE_11160 [Clostridium beijerinckii]
MIDINSDINNLLVLVGQNGAGKTHQLNVALENIENGIMITEDGMPQFSRAINKVNIDEVNMVYLYKNEEKRGTYTNQDEQVRISESAEQIVKYCLKIVNQLSKILNKSKGQEKLDNMMKAFLEYNFNNIKYVFFDEPENFLDEEYLKVVGNLINKLIEKRFIVRIATHNARLLKILDINIENIVLMNYRTIISVSQNEIIDLYRVAAKEINEIKDRNKMDEDGGIKYKLSLADHLPVLESFIEQNIKSEEFYRCLFCSQIIIVEGDSDVIALKAIKNEFDLSVGIFSSNGKAFIPFFCKLYLKLGKKVVVVIDDDHKSKKNAGNLNSSVALTEVLKKYFEDRLIKLVLHEPDLEKFYGINLDKIADEINMSSNVKKRNSGWLKYIASFMFFKTSENKEMLKNHIIGRKDEINYEFE